MITIEYGAQTTTDKPVHNAIIKDVQGLPESHKFAENPKITSTEAHRK